MSVTIHRAKKQDYLYIKEKLQKYLLDSTNARWQAFFVAKHNNKTVAFGRVIDHFDFFEIASLGVDYYYRKKGIGIKMLSFLVDEARGLDHKKPIYCVSHIPGFTQKVGFREIPKGPEALEYKRHYKCRLDASKIKIMRIDGNR